MKNNIKFKMSNNFASFKNRIHTELVKISPLFHTRYRPSKDIVELNLIAACNLRCVNCECSCAQAPSYEHISLDQVERFVKESIEMRWNWKRIKLFGGEPTLHPNIFEVLTILEKYKIFNTGCEFELLTNGMGEDVNRVLSKMPSWIIIVNSTKDGLYEKLRWFESYNIAPADLFMYKVADFTKGCRRIEICGICLTKNGYYPCGPGAHVDRIFGFDIGIKTLEKVKSSTMKDQLKQLCKYCGLYKEPPDRICEEKISDSWRKAYKIYKENPPLLSDY
jgi:hypothetical protein